MPVSEFLSQVPIPIHTTSNSLPLFIYPVGHYLHSQCLAFKKKIIFNWRIMDNGFTILCWFLPYNNMSQPEVYIYLGFPGGSDDKESAYKAGDLGSIPESGRSPGKGNGYPL